MGQIADILYQSRMVVLCAMLLFVASDRSWAAAPKETETYSQYAAEVISVAKNSETAVTLKGLWTAPDFDALASKAPAHIDDCIKFISERDHDDAQRQHAIYAMYKLPLESYVAFVRRLLALYDHHDASRDDLLEAIDPLPHAVPSVIFDNYDDSEVQAHLKDIAARPGWDENEKAELARLMDGGGLEYRLKTRFDTVMHRLHLD